MPQQGDALSGISHEITQELLGQPVPLQRRCSFSTNPPCNRLPDRSEHAVEHSQWHRPVQSSGTWTTLSREGWSDRDEIEDREVFFEEYNRLAQKVSDIFNK